MTAPDQRCTYVKKLLSIRRRPHMTQSGNSAMSESYPRFRGELLGRRTLANKKMVNRVGCHKCGVTLWQMCLLPRVAKRHLDRVEVPPDGLEHNFGRRRVY